MLLIDTNIISFIFKGDSRIDDYKPYLEGQRLAISFMTVAELFQWAMVRNWGSRRIRKMETAMRNYLVLPFDIEVCRLWGEVRAECQSAGQYCPGKRRLFFRVGFADPHIAEGQTGRFPEHDSEGVHQLLSLSDAGSPSGDKQAMKLQPYQIISCTLNIQKKIIKF